MAHNLVTYEFLSLKLNDTKTSSYFFIPLDPLVLIFIPY
jgi:hypothetical protein